MEHFLKIGLKIKYMWSHNFIHRQREHVCEKSFKLLKKAKRFKKIYQKVMAICSTRNPSKKDIQ